MKNCLNYYLNYSTDTDQLYYIEKLVSWQDYEYKRSTLAVLVNGRANLTASKVDNINGSCPSRI